MPWAFEVGIGEAVAIAHSEFCLDSKGDVLVVPLSPTSILLEAHKQYPILERLNLCMFNKQNFNHLGQYLIILTSDIRNSAIKEHLLMPPY